MANTRNPAIRRIMADVRELERHPSPRYHAIPLEDNFFEWHFTIRGPSGTDFEGGVYHGRILLPSEYPFKPPNIVFLTRNGRFEVGTKICLSISAHHEESWQPAWGVRTMLEALISFLPSEGAGAIGALEWSREERQKCARESQATKCPTCGSIAALLKDETEGESGVPDDIAEAIAQLRMQGQGQSDSAGGDGGGKDSGSKIPASPSSSAAIVSAQNGSSSSSEHSSPAPVTFAFSLTAALTGGLAKERACIDSDAPYLHTSASPRDHEATAAHDGPPGPTASEPSAADDEVPGGSRSSPPRNLWVHIPHADSPNASSFYSATTPAAQAACPSTPPPLSMQLPECSARLLSPFSPSSHVAAEMHSAADIASASIPASTLSSTTAAASTATAAAYPPAAYPPAAPAPTASAAPLSAGAAAATLARPSEASAGTPAAAADAARDISERETPPSMRIIRRRILAERALSMAAASPLPPAALHAADPDPAQAAGGTAHADAPVTAPRGLAHRAPHQANAPAREADDITDIAGVVYRADTTDRILQGVLSVIASLLVLLLSKKLNRFLWSGDDSPDL